MIEQIPQKQQYLYDFRNDPFREPASMVEADEEYRELLSRIQAVDAQLATLKFGDPTERRRAMDAKRHMMDRRRLVASWKSRQAKVPKPIVRVSVESLRDVPSTQLIRIAAKRMGHLESVYLAAREFINNQTDTSWDELVKMVDTTDRHIAGDESGN